MATLGISHEIWTEVLHILPFKATSCLVKVTMSISQKFSICADIVLLLKAVSVLAFHHSLFTLSKIGLFIGT